NGPARPGAERGRIIRSRPFHARAVFLCRLRLCTGHTGDLDMRSPAADKRGEMAPPSEDLSMDKILRAYLAELVGTFLLVFLCAAAVCATPMEGNPPVGLIVIALAQGCIYAALLSATTLVSEGCLNPAVTLTLWVTKRFEGGRTLAMLAVQVIGAVAAGGLVCAVFNQANPQGLADVYAGTPHLPVLRA